MMAKEQEIKIRTGREIVMIIAMLKNMTKMEGKGIKVEIETMIGMVERKRDHIAKGIPTETDGTEKRMEEIKEGIEPREEMRRMRTGQPIGAIIEIEIAGGNVFIQLRSYHTLRC